MASRNFRSVSGFIVSLLKLKVRSGRSFAVELVEAKSGLRSAPPASPGTVKFAFRSKVELSETARRTAFV